MRWLALAPLALAACFHSNGDFACASDGACGAGGTCELTGFCSFADTSCSSGRRYGEFSGPTANQCVAAAPPPDAGPPPPPQPPSFAAESHTSGTSTATLQYSLAVPDGDNRFLLVTVQVGSDCANPVPATMSVTYDGLGLEKVASIVGTPCDAGTTRSEQWGLVAPPTGTHDVTVTLADTAFTLHSGALAFAGVNQTDPVRASMTADGGGTMSSVSVASAVGDLVVDTVGQGDSIVGPVSGDQRFLDNASSRSSLDNSAASTAPGAATVAMAWTFGNPDQWQTIATSLRP